LLHVIRPHAACGRGTAQQFDTLQPEEKTDEAIFELGASLSAKARFLVWVFPGL